jgi:hypothetical protein
VKSCSSLSSSLGEAGVACAWAIAVLVTVIHKIAASVQLSRQHRFMSFGSHPDPG